jgi:putative drug exporter of the RND superfamily
MARDEVMSRAGGIARFVCGRWTKWIVLAIWLVLFVALGPLSSMLTDAEKNDTANWLPGSAESTQVFEKQKNFQPADVFPAVIVYERTSGITDADKDKVQADAAKLATVDGVAGKVEGPFPAQDGQALQLVIPVKMATADQPKVVDRADAMERIAKDGGTGLSVHLTGPIGFAADNTRAFLGIDTTLLFATVSVVIVLLLIIYRSPILWVLPVFTTVVAITAAQAVIYLLAKNGLVVTAQSSGIMLVLVFGASTDYALLLMSRYRESLRQYEDRHTAMAHALRRAAPAVVASAATVTIAMLCLLFADMRSTNGLGPVVAVAIVVGLIAMLTLLPALLVIFGRWIFWPARPKYGSAEPSTHGVWARLGGTIARRPRIVWIGTALVLAVMALGLTKLDAKGLAFEDTFITKPSSVVGEEVMAKHYPAGQGQPVAVIANAAAADQVKQAFAGTAGITDVTDPVERNGLVYLEGTLKDPPSSTAAQDTVTRVRDAVHAVPGADAKVGGLTAMNIDLSRADSHDNRLIIPIVLFVVLVVLAILLRAVVAPLLLIATVVLSFAAALGISALVFKYVFGFHGGDAEFPLDVFVFLVALGIDYNIFLVTRVREEALRLGTRRGALVGLAVTGGVITSAGLVLAATFSVLASLPMVYFTEMGFAVALGVLLDTFIVRSVLVTALTLDVGRFIWWPSKLAAKRDVPDSEVDATPEPELVS